MFMTNEKREQIVTKKSVHDYTALQWCHTAQFLLKIIICKASAALDSLYKTEGT